MTVVPLPSVLRPPAVSPAYETIPFTALQACVTSDAFGTSVERPPDVVIDDNETAMRQQYVISGAAYRDLLRLGLEYVAVLARMFEGGCSAERKEELWSCMQGLTMEECRSVSSFGFDEGVAVFARVGAEGALRRLQNASSVRIRYLTVSLANQQGLPVVEPFDVTQLQEMYHNVEQRSLVIAVRRRRDAFETFEVRCAEQSTLRALYYALLSRHNKAAAAHDPLAHATTVVQQSQPVQAPPDRPSYPPPNTTLHSREEDLMLASNMRGRQAAPGRETPNKTHSREEDSMLASNMHERQAALEHEAKNFPPNQTLHSREEGWMPASNMHERQAAADREKAMGFPAGGLAADAEHRCVSPPRSCGSPARYSEPRRLPSSVVADPLSPRLAGEAALNDAISRISHLERQLQLFKSSAAASQRSAPPTSEPEGRVHVNDGGDDDPNPQAIEPFVFAKPAPHALGSQAPQPRSPVDPTSSRLHRLGHTMQSLHSVRFDDTLHHQSASSAPSRPPVSQPRTLPSSGEVQHSSPHNSHARVSQLQSSGPPSRPDFGSAAQSTVGPGGGEDPRSEFYSEGFAPDADGTASSGSHTFGQGTQFHLARGSSGGVLHSLAASQPHPSQSFLAETQATAASARTAASHGRPSRGPNSMGQSHARPASNPSQSFSREAKATAASTHHHTASQVAQGRPSHGPSSMGQSHARPTSEPSQNYLSEGNVTTSSRNTVSQIPQPGRGLSSSRGQTHSIAGQQRYRDNSPPQSEVQGANATTASTRNTASQVSQRQQSRGPSIQQSQGSAGHHGQDSSPPFSSQGCLPEANVTSASSRQPSSRVSLRRQSRGPSMQQSDGRGNSSPSHFSQGQLAETAVTRTSSQSSQRARVQNRRHSSTPPPSLGGGDQNFVDPTIEEFESIALLPSFGGIHLVKQDSQLPPDTSTAAAVHAPLLSHENLRMHQSPRLSPAEEFLDVRSASGGVDLGAGFVSKGRTSGFSQGSGEGSAVFLGGGTPADEREGAENYCDDGTEYAFGNTDRGGYMGEHSTGASTAVQQLPHAAARAQQPSRSGIRQPHNTVASLSVQLISRPAPSQPRPTNDDSFISQPSAFLFSESNVPQGAAPFAGGSEHLSQTAVSQGQPRAGGEQRSQASVGTQRQSAAAADGGALHPEAHSGWGGSQGNEGGAMSPPPSGSWRLASDAMPQANTSKSVPSAAKALVVACGLAGTQDADPAFAGFADRVSHALIELGFLGEQCILSDQLADSLPVRSNVIGAVKWLSRDLAPGSSTFCALLAKSARGDGILLPNDHRSAGSITTVHLAELFSRLPVGCHLTLLSEHTSTTASGAIPSALPFVLRLDDSGAPRTKHPSTPPARSCGRIVQVSFAAVRQPVPSGLFSGAFADVITAGQPPRTMGELLQSLHARAEGRYRPVISSNRPLLADSPFSLGNDGS
ncbi:hypothetical protein DIPPA_35408 [Diplonema papillatum]|nr:hypothetical protein DIPPA_35408 [Diplonema papillatum]